MSLEKIKSSKNIAYTDRYSKNSVLNSLIKNKLQTQIIGIKESFANIMRRQQENQALKSATQISKRKTKAYTIHHKAIQEAIKYNPLEKFNKITEEFVAQRQIDSFLVPQQQLIQINKAREQYNGILTKLNKNDGIQYKIPSNLQQFSQKVMIGTINTYSDETWLPRKPEIVNMIQDRKEQIQEQFEALKGRAKGQAIEKQLQKFTQRMLGKSYSMGGNSKKVNDLPLISGKTQNINLKPTEYFAPKYHKNDYKLVETWLQNILQQINKQTQYPPQAKLNMVYGSYISVWKEIIRLTYIQSQQKGLLIEKMFYSLLRLFSGLISQQQALSRSINQQKEVDSKELKVLMEERMQELNKRYLNYGKEIEKLQQINFKLSQIVVSFEKVNRDLVEELEKVTREKKYYQSEFNSIGNNYFKTLELLHDKSLIEMDVTKNQNQGGNQKINGFDIGNYKTFFMLGNNSKPTILGRFKVEDSMLSVNPRYAQMRQKQEQQQSRKYNERHGRKLKEIQNQLVRYWTKKQNDLQLKGIINTLVIGTKLEDACVGTARVQSSQFQCQFPENNELYVQKLLNELRIQLKTKHAHEISHLYAQIQQKQALFQKWKLNYEELQQKNKMLHEINMKTTLQAKRSKQSINQLVKQVDMLKKVQQKDKREIEQLKQQISQIAIEKQQIQREKLHIEIQNASLTNTIQKQRENNKMLVRANLEMKEKVQKFDIRYNMLLKNVKNVVPWLNKFLAQIDKSLQEIDLVLLKNIGGKIEEYLSQFVIKDSNVFMTRVI